MSDIGRTHDGKSPRPDTTHEITVFADISCPFAYVSLDRILRFRHGLGAGATPLRVRAWPLERVNGSPLTGPSLVPKVEALRRDVAPHLFSGFDPTTFPGTTVSALAAEHVAYEHGPQAGMDFSMAIRRLLFEDGGDIGDDELVADLLRRSGLRPIGEADIAAVDHDHEAGRARGVSGSPHYFTAADDFFCPTLEIGHDDSGYDIGFDDEGFTRFVSTAFG